MPKVRFGFWMPIFGGWLRNVEDEQMAATFDYNKRLAQRAEQIGFDISLLAELNLNDIKGATAPVLECWTTAAAIASVTDARAAAVVQHSSTGAVAPLMSFRFSSARSAMSYPTCSARCASRLL